MTGLPLVPAGMTVTVGLDAVDGELLVLGALKFRGEPRVRARVVRPAAKMAIIVDWLEECVWGSVEAVFSRTS